MLTYQADKDKKWPNPVLVEGVGKEARPLQPALDSCFLRGSKPTETWRWTSASSPSFLNPL